MSMKERELRPAPSEYTGASSISQRSEVSGNSEVQHYQLEPDADPQETGSLAESSENDEESDQNMKKEEFNPASSFASTAVGSTMGNALSQSLIKNDKAINVDPNQFLPPMFQNLECHYKTPTMSEHRVSALAFSSNSSNSLSLSSSQVSPYTASPSSRIQFARSSGQIGSDSPRAQRDRIGPSADDELSSNSAIGTDPLHALRLSMSHGSGFYMPGEEQLGNPRDVHFERSRDSDFACDDEDPNDRSEKNWLEHIDDSGYSASFSATKSASFQQRHPNRMDANRTRQGSKALESDDEDEFFGREKDRYIEEDYTIRSQAASPPPFLRHYQSYDDHLKDPPRTPLPTDILYKNPVKSLQHQQQQYNPSSRVQSVHALDFSGGRDRQNFTASQPMSRSTSVRELKSTFESVVKQLELILADVVLLANMTAWLKCA